MTSDRSTGARVRPLCCNGFRCPDGVSLAAALASNWSAAADFVAAEWPEIAAWLSAIGRGDVASGVTDAEQAGPDAMVFTLIHLLDPAREQSFRGILLREDCLRETATAALTGEVAALEWLAALWSAQVLDHALLLAGADRCLAPVSAAWRDAVDDHEARARLVAEQERALPADDVLDSAGLAKLLAAAFPGRGLLPALNREVEREVDELARECGWFRSLLHDARAAPGAALLALQLAPHARDVARRKRADRLARLQDMWRSSARASAAGALAGLAVHAIAEQLCAATAACGASDQVPLTIPVLVRFMVGAVAAGCLLVLGVVHARFVAANDAGGRMNGALPRILLCWSAIAIGLATALIVGLGIDGRATQRIMVGAAAGAFIAASGSRPAAVSDRRGRPATSHPRVERWAMLLYSVIAAAVASAGLV